LQELEDERAVEEGKISAAMGLTDPSKAGSVSFERADILEAMTVQGLVVDSALGARPMAEMDMVMWS